MGQLKKITHFSVIFFNSKNRTFLPLSQKFGFIIAHLVYFCFSKKKMTADGSPDGLLHNNAISFFLILTTSRDYKFLCTTVCRAFFSLVNFSLFDIYKLKLTVYILLLYNLILIINTVWFV